MDKICKKCGQTKSFEEFHIDIKAKDGHRSICKSCRSVRRKLHISLSIGRKKFDKNLNSAIYRSLKTRKSGSWERIFNFSLEHLVKHLESQFTTKMNWGNYGSYWWIDKIIPRVAYRYQNVKNNEFLKCWSLKNMRPLPKYDCVRKGNKILRELIEKYNLFDIMPVGLVVIDKSSSALLRNELETLMKEFVNKLENDKFFDKNIYIRIMDASTSWNKAEILGIMVDKIRILEDYNEEKSSFDYKEYLDMLLY
jgi:hypothetical protein